MGNRASITRRGGGHLHGPACPALATVAAVTLLAFGAGCRGPVESAARPAPWSVEPELDGRLLVVELEHVADGEGLASPSGDAGTGLPVDLWSSGESLTFLRDSEVTNVYVLTFERAGERSDYGVYSLGKAKQELSVPPPLDGDPIRWENRDPPQALAYQLRLAGLEPEAAAELVSSRAPRWFGEGLRVFFVVVGPLPAHQASPAVLERAKAMLIRVDLVQP